MLVRIDHEGDVASREALAEAPHDGAGGIVRVMDAENELDLPGVVLVAKRGEVRLKLGLSPAKWLQNREIGGRKQGDWRFLGKTTQQRCRKRA